MKKEYLKDDPALRRKLKTIGFILVFLGGICLIVGLVDFFSTASSVMNPGHINPFDPIEDNSPDLFWMIFVGMFLLFPGGVCLGYAYMGKVARYTSSQITPVVTDTVNYMIDGTKDQVIDVIDRVRGKDKEKSEVKGKKKLCPKCYDKNDEDAKFCDNCGTKLTKTCIICNSDNDADASFCNQCGNKL